MKTTCVILSTLFVVCVVTVCGVWAVQTQMESSKLTYYPAVLCNDCGFGNKKDNCCKCGKWMAGRKIPARLCSDCGFGNKKDNCCKCGKWTGSTKIPAYICNDCGFGNKKDYCCKCGKWAP